MWIARATALDAVCCATCKVTFRFWPGLVNIHVVHLDFSPQKRLYANTTAG